MPTKVKRPARKKKVEIPEGATLFAFSPKYAKQAREKFGVDKIWVMPPEERSDYHGPKACQCQMVYPAVTALLPGKWRGLVKRRLRHARPDAYMNVCACHGSVTESVPPKKRSATQ